MARALAGLLALILAGCAGTARPGLTPVAVRQGAFEVDVVTTAVVKPEEVHEIGLPAGIWGGNLQWMAKEGAMVKKGQVVARISQRHVVDQLTDALDTLADKKRQLEREKAQGPVKKQEIEGELLAKERAWRQEEVQRKAAMRGGAPEQVAAAKRDLKVADLALSGSDAEVLADLHARGVIARAEAEKARLDQQVAELDRRRARLALDLLAPGAREEEVEKARLRAEMAKAALDAMKIEAPAKRELLALEREKRQVDVRAIQKKVKKLRRKADSTTLEAPADGMLLYPLIWGWKRAYVGMEVWNGLNFLQVSRLASVKLEGAVPEAEVAKVRKGLEAEITADGWPGKVIKGKVTHVSKLAKEPDGKWGRSSGEDDGVKRFDVTVVPIGPTPELKPNMRVKVRILAERRAGATSIPAEALFGEGDARYVWLAGAAGPEKRAVALAASGRDWVALKDPLPADAKVYLLDPTAADDAAAASPAP